MRRLALVVFFACHDAATPPPPIPEGATRICEPCVGELSGIRVGVADIFPRDGKPSAHVSLWDPTIDAASETRVVFVGTDLALHGDTYRVLRIDESPHGAIVVQKAP